MKFTIEKKLKDSLGRAGAFETPHGVIHTPTFAAVGTKATVKALTPAQLREIGAEVVLGNTYHLYLEPGEKIVEQGGGLGKFMGWEGPTITDSGGFQAFSLGFDFNKKVGKIGKTEKNNRIGKDIRSEVLENSRIDSDGERRNIPLAKIDEEGVTFKSVIDGSSHRFTAERSIEIQRALGADIIFAFDECTSPDAPKEYQKQAMERTHKWAERSLERHLILSCGTAANKEEGRIFEQALFGIVQGGRFSDLRKKSARVIGSMEFDGFGIGGSFEKEDVGNAVRWVNEILPEEKPRHLLGIGEPADLFAAVRNGCDLFDCVAPTRQARNGTLYTTRGKINIENAKYKTDFSPVEDNCGCYTCLSCRSGGAGFTKAYLSHLFRSGEILANTLATIHNLHFIVHLVKKMRNAILGGCFEEFKNTFFSSYRVH